MDMDKREELENESKAQAEAEKDIDSTETAKTDENAEKKKKKKLIIIIVSIIVALAVVISALIGRNIYKKLNLIDYDGNGNTTIDPNQEFIDENETLDFEQMDDATGNDFKSILKNWATNGGEKMSSKNIINVLLIGSDASSEDSKRPDDAEKGNTDVMMIVSINKKSKTIKLASIMRDSYTYMSGFDRYAKLNSACQNGGPAYLVETIENDYKIKIDGYVLVDFDSFKEVIDVLGGVNVDVPEYVANHLNSSKDYDDLGVVPSGEGVLLNGKQALAFSRVRKTNVDGDVSRVARQRQVIYALIEKCGDANIFEKSDVADVVAANVRTNFTKKQVLNYGAQAVASGWADFEMSEITMPTEDARYGYTYQENWIWVVDYPLAAQNLQKEIYGTTNINLEENRKTAITVMGGYVTKG